MVSCLLRPPNVFFEVGRGFVNSYLQFKENLCNGKMYCYTRHATNLKKIRVRRYWRRTDFFVNFNILYVRDKVVAIYVPMKNSIMKINNCSFLRYLYMIQIAGKHPTNICRPSTGPWPVSNKSVISWVWERIFFKFFNKNEIEASVWALVLLVLK